MLVRAGIAAGVLGGLAPAAGRAESLHYTLRPEPQAGQIAVELLWQTGPRTQSGLHAAQSWGTVADVPALFQDVVIGGGTQVRREAGRWFVRHRPEALLRCRYRVRAASAPAADRPHLPVVTQRYMAAFGATLLLAPLVGGGLPGEYDVVVRWELPAGWQAAGSLGGGPGVGQRLSPAALLESAWIAGALEQARAPACAGQVHCALAGRFAFGATRLAETAARILEGQCALAGAPPVRDLMVLVWPLAGAPDGASRVVGSALHESLALLAGPDVRLDSPTELLLAHELFHQWNGRLLRPAEPEERLYWFVEGLTEYYALRCLHESGCWSDAQLAAQVNRHLREYALNPAADADNERIAREYWSRRETVGQAAYQRGVALGLRWHALARQRGVPEGLDRLLRRLLEEARSGGGPLTAARIRQAGAETLGGWFAQEYARYVEQASVVPVPADALAPALRGELREVWAYELGFDRQTSLARRQVCGLRDGSAAARAGLREGDRLRGWRIPAAADEPVVLQVERGGVVRTVRYLPRGRTAQAVQFVPARDGAARGTPFAGRTGRP